MRRCILLLLILVFPLAGIAQQKEKAISLPGLALANEQSLLQALQQRQEGRLLWSSDGRATPQATELMEILRNADRDGLRPEDYGVAFIAEQWSRAAASGPAGDWAGFDALLSHAALRLVSHLHYGRIDPRSAGFELREARTDLDVAATVAALATAARVRDAIAAAEPRFHHYHLLKKALAPYRALAANPTLTLLPAFGRRSLHEGDAYAGASALRRLLVAFGDMPAEEAAKGGETATLDPALTAALKRFQTRNGLTADGTLGAKTFATLTMPLAQRVRRIELTLERWRWLPALTTPPIMVNIPQFRLFAFKTVEDRAADIVQMPVIVGQAYPRTRTPVFLGEMRYVIFRPYWDVPASIARRELLPDIRKDSGYLAKHNMEIVDGESDDSKIVAPTPAALDALEAGQLRLRQRPGPDNALGPIKFMFPNVHNVYLHGTPAQHLFEQSSRAFSHGCIRVSDPVALAEHVLKNADGDWNREKILAAMKGDENQTRPLRVNLRQPIRVMIVYGTVLATEAGPVQFFEDIYGHDRKLETLLGMKPVYTSAAPR